MKNFKKVLALVLAFVMVLGLGSMTFAADTAKEDIVLNGDDNGASSMIGDYTSQTGTGYNYVGFSTTKEATDDYKYLQLTYTGDVRFLRIEADGEGGPNAKWFDSAQALHLVTADGSDIPLEVTEPTTIVIDLEASGYPATGSYIGYHMHYLDGAVESNGFVITDARLKASLNAPVVDDSIVLNGDVNGASSMVGDYTSQTGTGYNYVGFSTTKDATDDYKYLQLTYTGDVRFLRIEADGEGGPNAKWFDSAQALHLVTADGSDIPLEVTEPTTIVIDLEASGYPATGSYIGYHMHYLDGAVESNGFVITDARLTKTADVVAPEESTEESTEAVVADYIVLNGDDNGASSMIGDYTSQTGTGYNYVGFSTTKEATDDYKYLQLTYTGDVRFLRIEADGEGGPNAKWFDSAQALHLVTADGSDIPLEVTEPTTIVIDLEASGYPATGSYIGYHMHYLDGAVESNGFVITDARLTKSATVVVPEETTAAPEETTAAPEETTVAPEETTAAPEETTIAVDGNVISMIILDGDDKGDSSMMGDYSDKTGTGYKYVGFATTKDATDDYKYLVIEYVGDVRFLRLEADGEGGANAKWFDQTQEKHINIVAIVDADGNELDELPLETDEPISIMIDLEASGFPATGSYIGYHMHYLDPEVDSNGFVISAAALITDIPEEDDEIVTVAPSEEATTEASAEETTKAPGTTAPSTGDSAPVAVVMVVCLLSVVVLGGTVIARKRNF